MPRKTLRIEFPAAGLNRRHAFQDQPPFTTPAAENVQPYDALEGRERGGSRPGLAKAFSTSLGGVPRLLTDVAFVENDQNLVRMVAAAAGNLFYEQPAGQWAAGPAGQLSATQKLMGADRGQKLFIADFDPNYTIASTARKPKIWDPVAKTLTDWASQVPAGKGTLPLGCSIVVLFSDRLWLAGDVRFPHIWYASRQGDPFDFNFSALDVGGAIANNSGQPGQLGEPITAMIPHSWRCLLIGCIGSVWLIRGDPKAGGSIVQIDNKIGVLDRFAWCHAPANADGSGPRLMVFMSNDGLYVVPAGCESETAPQKFSRLRLPEELIGIDRTLYEVSLEWDVRRQGIHVYIISRTGLLPSTCWFIDWVTRGIFPLTLQQTHHPFCTHHRRITSSTESTVMLACRDGYMRSFVTTQTDDDGSPFDQHVDIGPLFAGERGLDEGVLTEIVCTLARNSGDLAFEIRAGHSAEEAFNAGIKYRGVFQAGNLGPTRHPRVRGSDFYLRLRNAETGRPWALERLIIEMERHGRISL